MFIAVPILPSSKRDPSIERLILIIEVGIGLNKIRITVKITVRVIHLNNQLKGAVSIRSATTTTGSILFSTPTSVISNITSRIANIIEVILNIIRIGKITKTNRITRIIVAIRRTTRTSRIVSKTVNKVANSAEDLVLRPV